MGLLKDEAENADDDDETDSEDDSDSESGEDVDKHGNLRDFVVPDDDISDVDSEVAPGQAKPVKQAKAKKAKSKGKNKADKVEPHMLKHLRKEASKNADARRKYMRYLRKNWEPSAKVDKACQILEGLKASGEKTIIFSVWTGLLDLLEVPIKHRMKLSYERYDGGMSASQRDTAARKFMNDPRVTVMLVSLKAGNAGLNLTAASQVIIMDPFWNPYIEMQAVDRAHRIGQQRPVHVHRILVKGTVEDRIIDLQEQKRALVDAALDEGAHKSIGRLDVRQLRYLFGVNS
jgi:SNF2 family DNA or RNA helicase